VIDVYVSKSNREFISQLINEYPGDIYYDPFGQLKFTRWVEDQLGCEFRLAAQPKWILAFDDERKHTMFMLKYGQYL
jgi:hypothetical protein